MTPQTRQAELVLAESRQQMGERQQREWQNFREELLPPAMQMPTPEAASYVKSIAETIRITQEGERKAQEFASGQMDEGGIAIVWEE